MADEKKKAHWTLEGSIATMAFPTGETVSFDWAEIFTGFDDMTPAEQYLADYGAKQNVVDKIALPKDVKKTPEGLIKAMQARWDALKAGTWKTRGPRAEKVIDKEKLAREDMEEKKNAALASGAATKKDAEEFARLMKKFGYKD